MTPSRYRKILEQFGWSQGEAAEKLGVTDRHCRRWIAGDTPIPRAVEIVLESAVDPSYLGRALGLDNAYIAPPGRRTK
ncbi:MAG TPA: helix-turn-helix transcriptional regulator [Rhizomicrobium sp.]|nr:helix-turn-helix transcriptional regulator [Rhizomicrobium sp.]